MSGPRLRREAPGDGGSPIEACDRLVDLLARARRARDERAAPPSDLEAELPIFDYASSLLRMRVRPALDPHWADTDPVQISLFGGTNSGKSTLLNVLLGRAAAGMNVTARFSQHPEAYRLDSLGDAWLREFPTRFAGYERHDDRHPPRQTDDELRHDGYRAAFALIDPNHVAAAAPAAPATTTAVFWDVPDFSTEEAAYWLPAVLDTIAVADLVLLAVTDESYADARVGSLLRMVVESRVTVWVVANKIAAGSEVTKDIETKLGRPVQHRLPFVDGANPEARLAALLAGEEAEGLRRAVAAESGRGLERKREALGGAVRFLAARFDELVAPLADELSAATAWRERAERATREEFLDRYRADYLQGERYGEFNQTLVRVMDLLEVPGVGELVRSLRDVVRLPLRALSGLVRKVMRTPPPSATASPEHQVVAERFEAWMSTMRAEAERLAEERDSKTFRAMASRLADPEVAEEMAAGLEEAYGAYRPTIEREVEERAAEIYRTVRDRPVLLNALRGANLAVDTAAIVLVVKSGGLNWSDAVLGPAVAGIRRVLFEAGMERYLFGQERRLKEAQFDAMAAIADRCLTERAAAWFALGFAAEDLERAREDFAVVRAAALEVSRGGAPVAETESEGRPR